MLKLETLVNCPACGGDRLRRMMSVADFESDTGEYGLVDCARCGAAFTSPRPIESELPRLYAARSTTDFAPDQGGLVGRLRALATNLYLRRTLGTLPRSSTLSLDVLDYGCGDGTLSLGVMRHAKAHGLQTRVVALDFHPEAPAALAGSEGRGIAYSCHAEWQAGNRQFDAVFVRHVLEHHPEPRRLLAELRRCLRPGGRLFLEVPNRRTVWATVFGRYFFGYYVPRHLLHFDPGSLRSVVEASGLRCVELLGGHTPLLGRSIGYRTGWNIGNLGFIGLASYPIQLAVDMLAGRSSTLRLTAMVADA